LGQFASRLRLEKFTRSRAVCAAPAHLTRLCFEIYEAGIFPSLIQHMFSGKDVVSPAEWQVIRAIREAVGGRDSDLIPA
jgi:hypothetical protein